MYFLGSMEHNVSGIYFRGIHERWKTGMLLLTAYTGLCIELRINNHLQRWSPRGRPWPRGRPRGHILKSLASKVKSLALASKPQVLENWPVRGSRTALFFELLQFCEVFENFFGKRFFVEIA